MRCQYAFDDAGYVLGALPPDERRAFVSHLPACADCRASVRDLAGLPGLLARVDPSDVEVLDGPVEPAPATLLPRLLSVAQADQLRARRRRMMTFAVAACLVILAAVSVPMAFVGLRARDAPPVTGGQQQQGITTPLGMRPVAAASPVRAQVGLADTRWGTKVALKCTYEKSPYGGTGASYSLVAVARSGKSEQLGSWNVAPGEEIQMSAPTRFHRAELAALEIRRSDGQPILRADL